MEDKIYYDENTFFSWGKCVTNNIIQNFISDHLINSISVQYLINKSDRTIKNKPFIPLSFNRIHLKSYSCISIEIKLPKYWNLSRFVHSTVHDSSIRQLIQNRCLSIFRQKINRPTMRMTNSFHIYRAFFLASPLRINLVVRSSSSTS